jgi:BASS family bile acid:Na+ symporter
MSTTIFSDILLPATLAIITLGLGLSISVQDIRNLVFNPGNTIIGLLCQLLLLPIIAFSIALITGMNAEYAVGLVIISACPGGATSNLVNYMIRGNVALSLSITIINGLITIFTIPLVTKLAMNVFLERDAIIQLPFMQTVLQIFLIVVIPATTGILIRMWNKKFANKLENPLRYILPLLLLVVYSGLVFLEREETEPDVATFISLFPFTMALNFLCIAAGFYVPALFRLSKRNRFTIAVEVGLQNSTLAIFVAATLLGNYKMTLVAIVYGSFSFFSTWLLGYLAKRFL